MWGMVSCEENMVPFGLWLSFCPPNVESGKDLPMNQELTISRVSGLHLLSTH